MSTLYAVNLLTNSCSTISLDEYLEDIIICGDYAYIADHDMSIICIVDISNLNNFVFKGTYEYKSEQFYGLQVVGNYAYIVGGESGIEIFDVSDIRNPTFVKVEKITAFSLDIINSSYLYAKVPASDYVQVNVLQIRGDDLVLVNQVKISEDIGFRIENGIIYYVSESEE